MQLNPGTLLQGGKYKIERVLRQGGFGITYLAEQVLMERKVCIKEFFLKEYCDRDKSTSQVSLGTVNNRSLMEKYLAKFLKEARMIARLDHPNIIRILDVFEENNTAYYVMDYVEGKNLNDLVKEKGALPEAESIAYIRQVGEGLAYVHEKGITHLDIKPGNIMLRNDGRPVLIDFGMSKQYDESGEQTSSTPIGVSSGYAPLELYQASGVTSFSPQTDIYELAATLYRLVTGEVPPSASDVMNEGLPEKPMIVSDQTWNAIEKAMQPRRKDRPQSVAAFLSLLGSESNPTPVPISSHSSASDETAVVRLASDETVIVEKVPVVCDNCGEKLIPNAKFCPNCGTAVVLQETSNERTVTPNKPKKVVNKLDTNIENGHEWVDLGLSVKWATYNIGAAKPEDYGSYFAWGETSPKDSYSDDNYKYFKRIIKKKFLRFEETYYETKEIIKYNNIDSKTRLDSIDDAARANWGGKWRMPTGEEMTELREKCKWEWTTQGGKKGYKVIGKNGNSIFLPAAGYRGESGLYLGGSYGYYWSSSLDSDSPNDAWNIYFHSGEVRRYYRHLRYDGFSVRPVTE